MSELLKKLTKLYKNRIEYHRGGISLLPDGCDLKPGVATLVLDLKKNTYDRFCNCTAKNTETCDHLKEISEVATEILGDNLDQYSNFNAFFEQVRFDKMSSVFHRFQPVGIEHLVFDECDGTIKIMKKNGESILHYSPHDDQVESIHAFLGRIGLEGIPSDGMNRNKILKTLKNHTLDEVELTMLQAGRHTRKTAFENSFWYSVFYHLSFQVHGFELQINGRVDKTTGLFILHIDHDRFDMSLMIQRENVGEFIFSLGRIIDNIDDFKTYETKYKSVVKLSVSDSESMFLELYLKGIDNNGNEILVERKSTERFIYGEKIYLAEQKQFIEIESPDIAFKKFKGGYRKVIKKNRIPEILSEFKNKPADSLYIFDESIKKIQMFKHVDQITLLPGKIENDWYYLSVKYSFGNDSVSLSEIYHAKLKGRQFIKVSGGWVDCHSIKLDQIGELADESLKVQLANNKENLKLDLPSLFKLVASLNCGYKIAGESELKARLKKQIRLEPVKPLPILTGMSSDLRKYQVTGTEWLTFLNKNRLGGLLCDDMGLGKTHQLMAFMLYLREVNKRSGPCLIVCPKTVMSHWVTKIRDHAPGLSAQLYHETIREHGEPLDGCDVLITSYGLLRQDAAFFGKTNFLLVIYDEAQHVKNTGTKVYKAASNLKSEMVVCVTGTPIENSVKDLKSLMDLAVPGYLGSDTWFHETFTKKIDGGNNKKSRKDLRALIHPFIMRRMKKTVLDELPDKIEDVCFCTLSDDQVKLYRDAINSKGKKLIRQLKDSANPIPYIHILALLTLLKQICDHPLIVKSVEIKDNNEYQSGKWDLFKELLAECLDSGQKVVVFTQYIGMIDMIHNYLNHMGIENVILTGKTNNRGDVIDRFNTDPKCRVFAGSLLAGGSGIDLVAASVVIHYDRWWNAAKEDQATDRVYRIGQKKCVNVYKLITTGTLEEKISSIIDKKRILMNDIIGEDNPDSIKAFSREQLIDMLSL